MATAAKFWNLKVSETPETGKQLDLQVHGVIDGSWMDEMNGDPVVSTAAVCAALAEHPDAKKINVSINSVGGSLFGGVALYNVLQQHGADVTCRVDGIAASAASLVAMAGKTVMGRGSMLMVHNPSASVQGDAKELRQRAADLDKAQAALVSIYTAKTGKTAGEVRSMLDAETFMVADHAVRAGFADEMDGDDADGDAEPDEGVEDLVPVVRLRSVSFPRAALPAQFLAMVKPKVQTPARAVDPAAVTPVTISVITRDVLAARAPALLAALVAEGHASGVLAERSRLQEIDELATDAPAAAALVADAKYGATPGNAKELAVAIVKAKKGSSGGAGSAFLEARRRESEEAARAQQGNADDVGAGGTQARNIAAMIAGGNARRGEGK